MFLGVVLSLLCYFVNNISVMVYLKRCVRVFREGVSLEFYFTVDACGLVGLLILWLEGCFIVCVCGVLLTLLCVLVWCCFVGVGCWVKYYLLRVYLLV